MLQLYIISEYHLVFSELFFNCGSFRNFSQVERITILGIILYPLNFVRKSNCIFDEILLNSTIAKTTNSEIFGGYFLWEFSINNSPIQIQYFQ